MLSGVYAGIISFYLVATVSTRAKEWLDYHEALRYHCPVSGEKFGWQVAEHDEKRFANKTGNAVSHSFSHLLSDVSHTYLFDLNLVCKCM